MLQFIVQGGIVLWIIISLGVVSTVVVIERLLYFKAIAVDEEKLFARVSASIDKGHYDEALAICDTNVSPLSALMKVGIENRNQSEMVQKEMLRDAAAQEVPRLEAHVGTLGTISNISPLMGLLGTVIGTMRAFGVLGQFGAVSDPSLLAKGVAEALITTVGGICVAVPSVIFYNFLVTKVNSLIIRMENQVNKMILMINGRERAEGRERRGARGDGSGIGDASGDSGGLLGGGGMASTGGTVVFGGDVNPGAQPGGRR
ncbi:MAG TPA: MotA/TolQ/ExbB proton channel family protein [Rectinemataceae bacterium]|nr:MotA/TolQ/ExbB proton channel family protein [Rectinemataceae bacterium]